MGALLFLLSAFSLYLLWQNAALNDALEEIWNELNTTAFRLNESRADISRQSREIEVKNAEIRQTRQTLDNALSELNTTKNELATRNQELVETKKKLDETSWLLNKTTQVLNETKGEFLQLKADIVALEESVNSSIQWFRDNSLLPPEFDNILPSATVNCVREDAINLGCIPYFLRTKRGFDYKFESQDRLYSISEMILRGGGDCEDYSLLLKALLNSFKKTGNNYMLTGWSSGTGEFRIYETQYGYKYYPNAVAHQFGYLQDFNSYMICYITGFNGSVLEGHCIVALSEKNITSPDSLGLLNGAETFEPQNGRYTGKIGSDFIMCVPGYACGKTPGNIVMVVSDYDLYAFHKDEWKSYQLYSVIASSLAKDITAAVGG